MTAAADLRARFDEPAPLTVGLEEEVMVLDAQTLDLAPRAAELIAAAADERLKPELPAAQVEVATPPCASVTEAAAELAEGRRALAAAADGLGLRLAGAGAHPFAATEGELTPGGRYDAIAAEYGVVARRQLVYALQVHVAVRPADRALAVYNALRAHLPELAALAANAPFHGGADTGLASIRPTIGEQLPRQGVAPPLASWEAYGEALRWVGDPGAWWWELRPHPRFGTLEIRVPDTQATVADALAVATVAHGLVAWLAARHDAGERLVAV
jgi:carboxylate-amine ligase